MATIFLHNYRLYVVYTRVQHIFPIIAASTENIAEENVQMTDRPAYTFHCHLSKYSICISSYFTSSHFYVSFLCRKTISIVNNIRDSFFKLQKIPLLMYCSFAIYFLYFSAFSFAFAAILHFSQSPSKIISSPSTLTAVNRNSTRSNLSASTYYRRQLSIVIDFRPALVSIFIAQNRFSVPYSPIWRHFLILLPLL